MDRGVADVAVIGAGPAGSAAARLLASWGHGVVLLGRVARLPALAESLPPSCTKLFDQIGVRRVLDDAEFVRATGNTVRWAGQQTRVERFDAGVLGYQVARNELDSLLARAARDAGVHAIDASVRVATREGDAWLVSFESGDRVERIRARWLVDASGRTGVIARRGFRKPDDIARTTAVVGVWQRATPWPVEDNTHTLVESYAGGWAWSVPVTETRRFVTVMLDPSVTELRREGGPRIGETYSAELAKTEMISHTVAGATMVGEPWACDASPYSATRATEDHLLLVGDAASFVDPLSSFGVKKALASAWLGAVAIHSSLTTASMTTAALELFDDRERVMHEHLRRQSAQLSHEAAGAHTSEFWNGRGEIADSASDELDVTVLRNDARVLAAFEELKRRPSINLKTGAAVHVEKRAMVRGHRMALEDHLVAPNAPKGVRYCRNVDLVLITRIAERHDQVPDLFDAYNRLAPPAPLPDFLGALSTLIGLGMLSFA